MNELYLVINCGSSSLKFSLYEMPSEKLISKGYFERIGTEDSFYNINYNGHEIGDKVYFKNHYEAVIKMMQELTNNNIINDISDIKGVGHRVLHGGEKYNDSVIIDDKVLKDIYDLTDLGPLHHPGEIEGIKAIGEALPNVKSVAVFDTAFHQTIPKYNYLYAVPYDWYKDFKVRKYGFHGTSHKYITNEMQKKLGKENVNLIICHVGSGASITCVKDGLSYDTSMGLTPLDGLVMGTRSGSIDPSIIKYMIDVGKMDINDIMNDLNKNSGLKGICGKNDFRDLRKLVTEEESQGILAYQIFLNSIIKFIAEYYFLLDGHVDAMVFTAGILENNPIMREDILNLIDDAMDIHIDKEVNDSIGYGKDKKEGIITNKDSKIPVYVIPTNEEVMIVRDTYEKIKEA